MLETLRRIVNEVNDAPDLGEALQVIVRRVKRAVQADVCSVYLTDFDKNETVLRATDGLRAGAVGKVRVRLDQGLIGLVTSRAEPLNLSDAHEHPNYLYIGETGEKPFHGFLGVPIIQNRQVLGVLVVRQTEPRSFDEAEETFLLTLASQLAGAITHARASGELAAMEGARRRRRHFLSGRTGSTGVGIGRAVVAYKPADLHLVPDRKVTDTEHEECQFQAALEATRENLEGLKQRMAESLAEEDAMLFDAWIMLLSGGSLAQLVVDRIRQGWWAPGALRMTIDDYCRQFQSMDDAYMRERAADVRDLGRRILSHLQEGQSRRRDDFPRRTILVGEDISAAQLAEVPSGRLVGLVCETGSSSSHVAILARALGIPAIMGVADLPVGRLEGRELVVAGFRSRVYLEPPPSVLDEYRKLQEELAARHAELEQLRGLPSETQDGVSVPLYLNTGLVADVGSGGSEEAQGIGLYRTELPFMVRDRFPSEEVQRAIYRRLLKRFHPRPVTLRTLDIGGDKPLPYFPIIESNPFLGWRGIRISLDHPEIFLTQVRAMLRAAVGLNNMQIMLPMISHLTELLDSKALIHQAVTELRQEGHKVKMPKIGAMIEVPAAIFQARALACQVDFISLGTNDLTQYLLAVDRNNPSVGDLYNDLHPAVLRALSQVIQEAGPYVDEISVCGEMAGNPLGAILLVGMGYRSLSVSAASLLKVKQILRNINLGTAEQLAASALRCDDPAAVVSLVEYGLEKIDLLHLVRPRN